MNSLPEFPFLLEKNEHRVLLARYVADAVKAAVLKEREACALICHKEAQRLASQQNADVWCGYADTGAKVCVGLIRAQGEK